MRCRAHARVRSLLSFSLSLSLSFSLPSLSLSFSPLFLSPPLSLSLSPSLSTPAFETRYYQRARTARNFGRRPGLSPFTNLADFPRVCPGPRRPVTTAGSCNEAAKVATSQHILSN
ncbi:hypothetical protein PUN28_020814 [Cardiocondyla obscurior]|uniref:Secreted protein n=1 Tax=Cardiocondyla obscurior TaxID=286306 RepID=A0AAW2E9B5_9HYME